MKKQFLILISLISLTSAVFAQEDSKARLGLHFSPNLSWFNPETNGIESNGSKLGLSYGLTADFRIFGSNNYYLSSGVSLMDFGGKLQHPDLIFPTSDTSVAFQGNTESTYSIRQVEIPLAVKLVSDEIGHTSIYGVFGMSFGFIVKAIRDQDFSYTGNAFSRTDEEVLNQQISAFRAALNLGGGIEYDLVGNLRLFAGITYQNGFTNILVGNYYELSPTNQVLTDPPSSNTPKEGPEFRSQSNLFSLNIGLIF